MSLEKLDEMKAALKAKGIDVEGMKASDLFRPGLDSETKNVLSLDLLRRRCEKRAVELATAS